MGMVTLPTFRWFQSRPKTAWCCRWVLGSVAVLALAAWVFTLFANASWWVPKRFLVNVKGGSLTYVRDTVAADGTSIFEKWNAQNTGLIWTTEFSEWTMADSWHEAVVTYLGLPKVSWSSNFVNYPPILIVTIPLWLVFVVTAFPALAAWRNRWVVKREVGRCPTCGYSRTGLAGGAAAPCPECGQHPIART